MTTISLADWTQSPQIIVGEDEKRILTIVALTDVGHNADQADYLLYELDRAKVLPDLRLPPDVVRIGSVVRYVSGGQERTVKLVMPADAGGGEYRVSVTSEHGAALIGLRPGQSISWLSPEDGSRQLDVLDVTTPASDHQDPDFCAV